MERKSLSILLIILACASAAHAQYNLTVLDNGTAWGSAAYGSDDGVQVGVALSGPFPFTTDPHALMWNSTAASQVDLNPSGYSQSIAVGARGGKQIGYALGSTYDHTILWSGTAASAIDLTPAGYASNFGNGTDGIQEVGEGYINNLERAMLWSGSVASYVDLTPSGAGAASAKAVDNGEQVGYASQLTGGYPQHAEMWHNTAASGVDINPAGDLFSQANAVRNGVIAGYGGSATDNMPHALVWNGVGTAIDLHSTMDWDYAWGTNGVQEAGYGYLNNVEHALVWSGTAASQVDLNQFAPGWDAAGATSIDSQGVVTGWVTYGGFNFAAIWTPTSVPEPRPALALLGLLPAGFLLRKRNELRVQALPSSNLASVQSSLQPKTLAMEGHFDRLADPLSPGQMGIPVRGFV